LATSGVQLGREVERQIERDGPRGIGQGRIALQEYIASVLHAIQESIGWISPARELRVVALMWSGRKRTGFASFYGMFSLHATSGTAHVCDDIACIEIAAPARGRGIGGE